MHKISEIDDYSISLNGECVPANYMARSRGDNVILTSKNGANTPVVSGHFSEFEIDGQTHKSAIDAAKALNTFVGNFKRGGSAPSPTPEEKDAYFTISDEWGEVELPKGLEGRAAYVKSFKGALYVSSSAGATLGIWKIDRKKKTITSVYPDGRYWNNWYEFDGNLFVSSTDRYYGGDVGILRLDEESGEFVLAPSIGGYNWQHWHEFNGDLFVSSSSVSGILKWDKDTKSFVRVHSVGYDWQHWHEFNGDLFVSSYSGSSGSTGILKLSGDTFTVAYNAGYRWTDWHEFNGDLFVSGSSSSISGILKLSGDTFTLAYNTGYNWVNWYEFNGNLFVSSTNSASVGILKLSGDAFTLAYDTGYRWVNWHESNGNLFVSSSYSSISGILKLSGDVFTLAHDTGYDWVNWYEFDGNLFVSSMRSSGVGILKLSGDAFVVAYDTGYNWQYWYELGNNLMVGGVSAGLLKFDSDTSMFVRIKDAGTWRSWYEFDGNLFVGSLNSSVPGIYQLNEDSSLTQVYPTVYSWQYWHEFNGDLFVSNDATGGGILKWNKDTKSFMQVYTDGHGWQYWYELGGNLFVSNISLNYRGILMLNSAGTGFDLAQSTGYGSFVRIKNILIPTVEDATVFNMESLKPTKIAITGTVLGDWILSHRMFVRPSATYPLESFRPFGVIPVGSAFPTIYNDNDVFWMTSGTTIIFTTK